MNVIVGGRRVGKTTHVLAWMRATGGVCIVHSVPEAERLNGENPDLRGRFFTVNGWSAWVATGGEERPVAVDNVDLVLAGLLRREIALATATGGAQVLRVPVQ